MKPASCRNPFRSLAAAALSLVALGAVLWSCGPDPQEMIREAKHLDQRFQEAFNSEDLDRLMETYWNNPDVVFMPTNVTILRGPEAIRAGYKAFFEGTNVKRFKLTNREYRALGNIVLGWGRFKLTTTPSLGPEVSIEGRYTEIIGKRDGAWVYLHDHASIPVRGDQARAAGATAEPTAKEKPPPPE
jgi:uncharacterized protein (TIGR02246 family)